MSWLTDALDAIRERPVLRRVVTHVLAGLLALLGVAVVPPATVPFVSSSSIEQQASVQCPP